MTYRGMTRRALDGGAVCFAAMASIEVREEDGVRYLQFGSSWVQGAMRLDDPWGLELEYTRDMMFPLLLREGTRWPASALVVGLGAASVTRFLYRHFPRIAQTVVEYEPAVVDAARAYFRLPAERARLRITVDDGADYMVSSDRRFDWLLVDGYDAKGRAGALDTLAFYCNCRARLADDGIATFNFLTWRHALRGSLERLRAAFGADHVRALPVCESGNVVALASTGAPLASSDAALKRAATRLRVRTGLDLAPLLRRIARQRKGD